MNQITSETSSLERKRILERSIVAHRICLARELTITFHWRAFPAAKLSIFVIVVPFKLLVWSNRNTEAGAHHIIYLFQQVFLLRAKSRENCLLRELRCSRTTEGVGKTTKDKGMFAQLALE